MSAAAVAAPEDPTKKPKQVVHKHYDIRIVVNIKRGKEEIEFLNRESERMYQMLGSDKETEWAKQRIEKIQDSLLSAADAIKSDLETKLKATDKEDALDVQDDDVRE